MTTFSITVDTSQFDGLADAMRLAASNGGEGLLFAVEGTIMPDLALLSQTEWNVRTGTYAFGWTAEQIDALSVMIDNDAEYKNALEEGWVKRGDGGFVPGGHVLGQAIESNIDALGGLVATWLRNQLGAV